MRIAWFGSSLVSAYWNGAATYYRGIVRALHERGHRVTFFEPDAFDRQAHRDIADPPWAEVVVYAPERWEEALAQAAGFDVAVKASGVGVNDAELEAGVPRVGAGAAIYWDVDAPATLARLEFDPDDALSSRLPEFDLVLTYGGGDPVVERFRALGAHDCVPIYNALDPETHHPVDPDCRFACDLAFVGNRLPDREARVEEFFFRPAELAPHRSFILGGSGWDDVALPANVAFLGHLSTNDHNAFNSTPLAVLNVSRESMAANGWSPATRLFEAAGAAACVITDSWAGIEFFLEPGREVLVADGGETVAELLEGLSPRVAAEIGQDARRRILREHTYAHRAAQLEEVMVARELVAS
jgi:spore maturation protein CgeB